MRTALLIALHSGMAATVAESAIRLGTDYTLRIGFSPEINSNAVIATDGVEALYILNTGNPANLPATTVLGPATAPASYILKLSPTGDRIVYLTVLGFQAHAMAVDPSGNVYVAGPNHLAKLNTIGTALTYQLPIGQGLDVDALAVDNSGRAYITGHTSVGTLPTTPNAFQRTIPIDHRNHAFVARVNAAGTAFDYATYLAGNGWDAPSGIAVNSSGVATVIGVTTSIDFPVTPGAYLVQRSNQQDIPVPFLTRLAPDGSKLIYSTFIGPAHAEAQAVAVDPSGNAAVYQRTASGLTLMHFNSQGTEVTFSKALPSSGLAGRRGKTLAMDATGNIYAAGVSSGANYPVKGSLFPCGWAYLTVFGPTGDLIQSTYLAGASWLTPNALALASNSAVYVAAVPDPAFIPARSIGTANGPLLVTRLSPNGTAEPVKLACVGNSASFDPGPVSPGEIVSLFGESLGPAQGTQPQVDPRSEFPTALAGVQVTFDQRPAPLLYVQDAQINAIAPWSLIEGQTTEICVTFNGVKTNCLNRPVAKASPGVFTIDGRYAAALNEDGTINSAANPARLGSIVSVFATGLGAIAPRQGDGTTVELPLPVHVFPTKVGVLGGSAVAQIITPLDVQYAGPAPFLVAGVSQINFRVGWGAMILAVGEDLLASRSRTFVVHVTDQ